MYQTSCKRPRQSRREVGEKCVREIEKWTDGGQVQSAASDYESLLYVAVEAFTLERIILAQEGKEEEVRASFVSKEVSRAERGIN